MVGENRALLLSLAVVASTVFAGCGMNGDANGSVADDDGEIAVNGAAGQAGSNGPEGAVSPARLRAQRPAWLRAPVVPAPGPAARQRLLREVLRSARAGMRPGVFAKVGDSNSDYPAMLYGLGCREVDFGRHRYLAPTHRRYTRELGDVNTFPGCRPANSFSRDSAATASNATTSWALTPAGDAGSGSFAVPPAGCPGAQNPVRCEIETVKPRWVTIMIGSGDAIFSEPIGRPFARNLVRIIREVRSLGPVPVIATMPPVGLLTGNENRRIAAANGVVWRVARRAGAPLINIWRAMTEPQMVGHGLSPDGLHLSVYGGDGDPAILRNAADLSDAALRHGANRRNLIWLQTLRRLDRSVAAAYRASGPLRTP